VPSMDAEEDSKFDWDMEIRMSAESYDPSRSESIRVMRSESIRVI
jgi:hypothetical protein